MADFVIIGGGVYGCAIAWELARKGAEVVLFEAKEIASGASGGLGKRGVRANGRDIRELPLMRQAYEIWPALHEIIDGDTGYERDGHLLLMENELHVRQSVTQTWMQNRQGIPSRLIDSAELREMEPYLSEQVIGAIFCPNDGIADHTATTRSYARAAKRLGVQIHEHTPITQLERRSGRVTAVITANQERIEVGKSLILVSNQHTVGFVQQELGLTLPLWEMLPQVMLTQPVDPMPLRHLIGHFSRTLAMKAVPGNQIMISGGWHGVWNAATDQGDPLPDQVEGNRLEAVAVYPVLEHVKISEPAADRRELISVDDIPIIDILPGTDNLLVGVGWSGHGWAIAPAVCQQMAEWAFTGNRPSILAPFAYSRFLTSA